jgi:hypothetical protein
LRAKHPGAGGKPSGAANEFDQRFDLIVATGMIIGDLAGMLSSPLNQCLGCFIG